MSFDTRIKRLVDDLLANGITREQAVSTFDRRLMDAALKRTNGNVTRAARQLGVHRNTLDRARRQWREKEGR
jgi:transposase-like protein